jgi:hypothetical protein
MYSSLVKYYNEVIAYGYLVRSAVCSNKKVSRMSETIHIFLIYRFPSLNRLNQTDPAILSFLPCLAFFRDSIIYLFFPYQRLNEHIYAA